MSELKIYYDSFEDTDSKIECWDTLWFELTQETTLDSIVINKIISWSREVPGYDGLTKATYDMGQEATKQANEEFSVELGDTMPLTPDTVKLMLHWTQNKFKDLIEKNKLIRKLAGITEDLRVFDIVVDNKENEVDRVRISKYDDSTYRVNIKVNTLGICYSVSGIKEGRDYYAIQFYTLRENAFITTAKVEIYAKESPGIKGYSVVYPEASNKLDFFLIKNKNDGIINDLDSIVGEWPEL